MRHAADAADAAETGGWLFQAPTARPEPVVSEAAPVSEGVEVERHGADDASTEADRLTKATSLTRDDWGPDADWDLAGQWSADTVAGAAERIISELAPTELARFPVVARRFFTDGGVRRRVVCWSLSGAPRADPLAYQLGGEVVTGLVLTALSCAATGVLGQVGTRHHNGVARWRRNRWAARKQLPVGPVTPLPHLSSIEVPLVGQVIEEAAEDAGLDPDRARRLSILVLAALTRREH
jgi:hypothetical protein